MSIARFAESKGFFEISQHIESPGNDERVFFIKTLLGVLATLPFAVAYKLLKTIFRTAGLLLTASLLLIVIGLSPGLREHFVKRVSALAADFADWILYPLALFTCLARLLLASVIHPSLFFRY